MLRTSRIATAAVAAAAVIGLSLGVAAPAQAAGRYPTLATANVRSAPTTASLVINVLPKGTPVAIDCYTNGQSVSGTSIWNHLAGAGGWISDSLLLTGSNGPVVPACPSPTASKYNRSAAVSWALAHWNSPNLFPNDCTWFVSQAVWAGGVPRTSDWTDHSLNPLDLAWPSKLGYGSPSRAAANADYFKNAVRNAGFGQLRPIGSNTDRTAGGAQLGDVILYDWDGNTQNYIVDHAAIVTKIDANGTVFVSQHSEPRPARQWNLDGGGRPLPSSDGFYLMHITY